MDVETTPYEEIVRQYCAMGVKHPMKKLFPPHVAPPKWKNKTTRPKNPGPVHHNNKNTTAPTIFAIKQSSLGFTEFFEVTRVTHNMDLNEKTIWPLKVLINMLLNARAVMFRPDDHGLPTQFVSNDKVLNKEYRVIVLRRNFIRVSPPLKHIFQKYFVQSTRTTNIFYNQRFIIQGPILRRAYFETNHEQRLRENHLREVADEDCSHTLRRMPAQRAFAATSAINNRTEAVVTRSVTRQHEIEDQQHDAPNEVVIPVAATAPEETIVPDVPNSNDILDVQPPIVETTVPIVPTTNIVNDQTPLPDFVDIPDDHGNYFDRYDAEDDSNSTNTYDEDSAIPMVLASNNHVPSTLNVHHEATEWEKA